MRIYELLWFVIEWGIYIYIDQMTLEDMLLILGYILHDIICFLIFFVIYTFITEWMKEIMFIISSLFNMLQNY
jgi:hypothetical protein